MHTKYPIRVEPNMQLPIQVDEANLDKCQPLLGGVVTLCNPLYSEARLGYNLAHIKNPWQIIYCYSKEEVAFALKSIRLQGLSFRIRGGRHDFEGESNVEQGTVIDISPMNSICISKEKKSVKVGGGVTVEKLYEALDAAGYILPLAMCGSIGISGITTVGGIGVNARYLGLLCDQVIEMELVNADGECMVINEQQYPDLFWALRGGLGSNFGVVTSITYSVKEVEALTYFEIFYLVQSIDDVIDCWQHSAPFADDRITSRLKFDTSSTGESCLRVEGIFWGSKQEWLVMRKAFEENAFVLCESAEEMSYLQVMKKLAETCMPPHAFKSTGSFIYQLPTKEAIHQLTEKFKDIPKGSYCSLKLISLQGAIARMAEEKTAYKHRHALYLIVIEGIWGEKCMNEEVVQWVNTVKLYLDTLGKGTYRGFTDFAIKDWQQQYYGDYYQRLQHIKTLYDAQNFFVFPQSIEGEA